jgi:hypothetical protein
MAIKIGMHTDNLRSLGGSFEAGLDMGAKFPIRPTNRNYLEDGPRNGIGSCFSVTITF